MCYDVGMARYEVVIKTKGMENVIRRGIRRENGAIAERNIAVDSAYANAKKHTEGDPTAYAIMGSVEDDPNAVGVVYFTTGENPVLHDTVITYRRVPPLPVPDTTEDELLASLVALDIGARI